MHVRLLCWLLPTLNCIGWSSKLTLSVWIPCYLWLLTHFWAAWCLLKPFPVLINIIGLFTPYPQVKAESLHKKWNRQTAIPDERQNYWQIHTNSNYTVNPSLLAWWGLINHWWASSEGYSTWSACLLPQFLPPGAKAKKLCQQVRRYIGFISIFINILRSKLWCKKPSKQANMQISMA